MKGERIRYQQTGEFHFLTFSCYRRRAYLTAAAALDLFEDALRQNQRCCVLSGLGAGSPLPVGRVDLATVPSGQTDSGFALERVRQRYLFAVAGYVVMPEHVHLLVNEPKRALLSKVIQALKLSVSMRSRERPFWLAHYYDFNVSGHEKFVEKLRYIHRNPVRRGLAAQPEDCHPTDEDLSVGTPVAVVELSPLSNGRARNCGDRIGLDGPTKRRAVARVDMRSSGCLLELPGPCGWTRFRFPGPQKLGTGGTLD